MEDLKKTQTNKQNPSEIEFLPTHARANTQK